MKVGWGNGNLIADLHMGVTDAAMRERWREGHYDQPDGTKPRAAFVTGWRKLAGRT